jgi:hypothetical protein
VLDNINYALQVLETHQESCGPLSFIDDGELPAIVCDGCGMRVDKGNNSAIFKLRGYEIELVQ